MTICYVLTVLGTAYLSTPVSSAYTAADATALQSALLSNYSSKVRPAATTVVDIRFALMHITELNIVNQELHAVGLLIVKWTDSRLMWTPEDYGDMAEIHMLLSDIWSPPLLLSNAADEIKIMNDHPDLSSVNIVLESRGDIAWLAPANFVTQCTVNIVYFPFDLQKCSFVVSSLIFVASDLQIGSSESSVDIDLYKEHGEWDLTKSTVENVTRILNGHAMPAVEFTTYLTRKYSYYLMNLILPVVILAIMAPFAFMLPVDSGEKIGYTLTILLSLSVVMTLVSNSIPPTSTNICALSIYLLTTYIICSVATLVTVVTCRLHDFHVKGFKMGRRLQAITRILARITMLTKAIEENKEKSTAHKHVSCSEIGIEMKGDKHLSKDVVNGKKAWSNDDKDIKELDDVKDVKEYSFEELATIFDKFNFFAFTVISMIVTLTFMFVLRSGDSS